MKAVILAGGYGTRISEETLVRPKPMVEVGDLPILWHILKIYSHYGINEFIICCGYKSHMIKEYFVNYAVHMTDLTIDLRKNETVIHRSVQEPWKITMVDTGEKTMTGGRLRRVRDFIGDETFCMTYGDGVCNVDIGALIAFHKKKNKLATLTAVQSPGRFGVFTLGENESTVTNFNEKPHGNGAWINGGFFVLEPGVIDYIEGDHIVWERYPLTQMAHEGQLAAFKHEGFWQPMDSLRDKMVLEELWQSGEAPWKVW